MPDVHDPLRNQAAGEHSARESAHDLAALFERLRADLESTVEAAVERVLQPYMEELRETVNRRDHQQERNLELDSVGLRGLPPILRSTATPVTHERVSPIAEVFGRLADDPDMLDTKDFAALIGVTKPTLQAKRKRGDVLGISQATNKFWFPRWQVDPSSGRLLEGLAELHDAFHGEPWAVFRFLVQRHPGLENLTGYEALRAGQKAKVLTVVGSLGEGGFS